VFLLLGTNRGSRRKRFYGSWWDDWSWCK